MALGGYKSEDKGPTNLCLFLPTGRTFTFHGVAILCDNETALSFTYTAMSDGKVKRATFQKEQIAGWSRW